MSWCRATLRNARVFARCNEMGEFITQNGRVEIRYRKDDSRAYHASPKNLVVIEGEPVLPDTTCAPVISELSASKNKKRNPNQPTIQPQVTSTEHPENCILAYTDGACSGNPGPAGFGIVLIDGESTQEFNRYIGRATNNIAELSAIRDALLALQDTERPVRVYTDSRYSIGVLTQGWKAKSNKELISEVKGLLSGFSNIQLIYVPGHKGHPLNERADQLAREAIKEKE